MGIVRRAITKKILKNASMAKTNADRRAKNPIPLTSLPKRQNLSFRAVCRVPRVQRVRCLRCPVMVSGTVPYCKASWQKAVFQPAPRRRDEVKVSSAREPTGQPPISSRAARRIAYPEPVHHATPLASLVGSITWTKASSD